MERHQWQYEPILKHALRILRWWDALLGLVPGLFPVKDIALCCAFLHPRGQLHLEDNPSIDDIVLRISVKTRRSICQRRKHVLDVFYKYRLGHPASLFWLASRHRTSTLALRVSRIHSRLVCWNWNNCRDHAHAYGFHTSFVQSGVPMLGRLRSLLWSRLLHWSSKNQDAGVGGLREQEHGSRVHVRIPLHEYADCACRRIPILWRSSNHVPHRCHLFLHHLLDGQVSALPVLPKTNQIW